MTVNTVRQLLAIAGVDDTLLFNDETQAQRLASDLFDDTFASCMDKSYEEIDSDLKSYAQLTAAQGQIRLQPGVKRGIKAFVQWTRDMIRTDLDPAAVPIAVFDIATLMRRYKSHENFVKKSSTISSTANPCQFTPSTKWDDWYPTFINFLRTIPGRDRIPLDYVCRSNDAPNRTPQTDILDEYALQAPLNGEAFKTDASEVHTYLTKFIAGNSTAEAKIQANLAQKNGRLDYFALRDHYEGIGINAVDILKADHTLESLFYSGEKKPHMWWDKFESELTSAFTTYDKKEGRAVYSNEMKLRALLKKINADFLQQAKSSIQVDMTRIPMTMTYEIALANFRNSVNSKFSVAGNTPHKTRRAIQQVRGRGRPVRGKRYEQRAPRGRGANRGAFTQKRTDKSFITLTDGTVIEYHPSFKFADDVFKKFKPEDKQKLYDDRAQYKRARAVKALAPYHHATYANMYPNQRNLPPLPPPLPPSPTLPPSLPPPNTSISSNSTSPSSSYASIMGGRNSQAGHRHYQGGRPN